MKKHLLTLILAASVSACSLAPDFKLPFVSAPAAFKAEAPVIEKVEGQWVEAKPAAETDRGQWWKIFDDNRLNELQAAAATDNLTLKAMAARVEQARGTAKIARASLFPALDANAGFTRQQPNAIARGMAPGGTLKIEESWRAGLGLSYEIDLFGGNINRKRAADADALSMEAQLNSARLAMQADIADTYFTIRALDAEKQLLESTLRLREDGVKILEKRLEIGTITDLDVSQATVDMETTRIALQSVIQNRRELEGALALLLGRAPAEFALEEAPLATTVPLIPAGLPSTLLQRRPDIAAAQYDLMAANARIGVARAAFFPSLALTATGGVESALLGDLFEWSSRSWALGPLLSVPVFRGGANIGASDRARAVYDQAVAEYRQQVLVAFKDVEDSLSRLSTLQRQMSAQKVAAEAALRGQKVADLRYDNGDVSYLEAITARAAALSVQREGIRMQGAALAGTVQLVRALGGGWETAEKSE